MQLVDIVAPTARDKLVNTNPTYLLDWDPNEDLKWHLYLKVLSTNYSYA